MLHSRNGLYLFLLIACFAGYAWLWVSYTYLAAGSPDEPAACIIKHVTGVPCPSCGSTRSVMSFFRGDMVSALYWNPFGFIIAAIMILSPLWILYDHLVQKDSLFRFYLRVEKLLRKKLVAIPAIMLVLLNWIWNFYKGL